MCQVFANGTKDQTRKNTSNSRRVCEGGEGVTKAREREKKKEKEKARERKRNRENIPMGYNLGIQSERKKVPLSVP